MPDGMYRRDPERCSRWGLRDFRFAGRGAGSDGVLTNIYDDTLAEAHCATKKPLRVNTRGGGCRSIWWVREELSRLEGCIGGPYQRCLTAIMTHRDSIITARINTFVDTVNRGFAGCDK